MAAGQRVALLVATSEYGDPGLRSLRAPAHEVQELRDLLLAQGEFDEIETVVDGTKSTIERKIAWLFVNRDPDDLALLYMSCHGQQNDHGWLSFAARDTELDAPEATSIEAAYVQRRIDESQASAKVVLLDCCFSGAFSAGWVRKSADRVNLRDQLAGRGTYIVTASNQFEYAFEGTLQVRDRPVFGSPFTQAVLEGIRSGGADRDGDGLITGDELYRYVHDEVVRHGRQTPTREAQFEGGFVIAKAPSSLDGAQHEQAPRAEAPAEPKRPAGNRWKARAPVALLALAVLGQLIYFSFIQSSGGPNCVDGELRLLGSPHYLPLLEQVTHEYQSICPNSHFVIEARANPSLLDMLNAEGEALNSGRDGVDESPELLALSDEDQGERFPRLQERLLTTSVFTLVANKETGVRNLTQEQIRQVYAGKITNWLQLGGNDLPIRLVGRDIHSSTYKVFTERLLGGQHLPNDTSADCITSVPGTPPSPVRCTRLTTAEVLDTVAATPGALGYAASDAATDFTDSYGLTLVRIDGQQVPSRASALDSYPFWKMGFAYTYGDPQPDSLTASFLNYLSAEAATVNGGL